MLSPETFVVLEPSPPNPLLLAHFGADIAAPLPSPLTVDVGSLVVVDTENKASQSGGRLILAPRATPTQGDPGLWGASLTRTAGRTVLATVQIPSAPAGTALHVGWDSNQTVGIVEGFAFGNATMTTLGTGGIVTVAFTLAVDYQVAVVQRAAGGTFQLIKGGTQWPQRTLLWVSNVNTSGTFPALAGKDVAQVDDLRVVDLPAPWNSDYGIATTRAINPVAGAAPIYPQSADAILEFSFTYTSGQTYGLDFRRTSSSNTWRAFASAGGALLLQDITAAVTTTHLNVASVFANATAYRVVIVAVGNVYTVYVNDVSKGTYTDAGSFQTTVTNWIVAFNTDGGMSSAVAWPRLLSLPDDA